MLMRWQNEDDAAAQLIGFLQQFLEIFKELKGKKFYVTGESVSTRFLKILNLF
jgi:carboxypeptidase D